MLDSYILGQVPSNLALYHLKPRIFFPSMMIIWGSLTSKKLRNPHF